MNQGDPISGAAEKRPKVTRRLSSHTPFQGMREILIEHVRQVYRLRITRNGKLILTK